METLNAQFIDCLKWINIEVGPASKAQKEVRAVLEGDAKLLSWGVDTILIGSYARDVAIYKCADVDIFVKLPRCAEENPDTVFSAVQRPLLAHYAGRVTEQRRSIKITGFEGDLSVDAVAAVSEGTRWKIPQTNAASVKNQWEETDPERLTKLSRDMNDASTEVNGSRSYVPVVKLVRQIREHHLGDAKPGGLYFELLTYWAAEAGIPGTSHAEILATALERLASQLERGGVVIDPAMGTSYAPAPAPAALASAGTVFRELATKATEALGMEKCPAAATWRLILGKNPRGWVFRLPDDCDESGKKIAAIVPNLDRGSDEARRFA